MINTNINLPVVTLNVNWPHNQLITNKMVNINWNLPVITLNINWLRLS
jgi:hypothetical protein